MTRTLEEEKEYCYIYLLKKHFKGDATALARTFALTRQKISTYERRWIDAVNDAVFAEEQGLKEAEPKAPSIRSLKDRLLIRISKTIDKETDPSKLANTYARLSEFQQSDTSEKSANSIADAVYVSIKKKK